MKKALCIVLSVLLLAALFVGCKQEEGQNPTEATMPSVIETPTQPQTTLPEETTPPEPDGIHYKGITSKDITPADLEEAEGRPFEAETLAGEDPLYIYNNVEYLGITYSQLQCILFEDHSSITLTYKLSADETVDAAMNTVSAAISGKYGEANGSTGGTVSYTWRDDTVNSNYIHLYPLNDTELKLSFNFYS